MSDPNAAADESRRLLEQALASASILDATQVAVLAKAPPDLLDDALRAFAADHGAAALPVLAALADAADRGVRRTAKRALYRLAQHGVTPPPRPAPRPVVERQPERAARAWLSGVDGTGSRAAWIFFEGGFGGSSLCSLILNDVVGVVEVAGGAITRKRLETELAGLRASQKLPWVETEPSRVVGLVAEALALHRALGTAPPPGFARWQPLFEHAPAAEPPALPAEADPALVERAAELLELPETAGWFVEPEAVQSDALDLLQARESRLVVAEHIKAEREEAIVTRVAARELTADARGRWARRLAEMALVFRATDRPEHARLAEAAAVSLAGETPVERHPLARALVRRGLELAGEVAMGRLKAADVSRKPAPTSADTGADEPGGAAREPRPPRSASR